MKLPPKINYFDTNFGGSFTPKLFCETQPRGHKSQTSPERGARIFCLPSDDGKMDLCLITSSANSGHIKVMQDKAHRASIFNKSGLEMDNLLHTRQVVYLCATQGLQSGTQEEVVIF